MSDSPTDLAKQLNVSRQRADQILHPGKHRARRILYEAIKCKKIARPSRCDRCKNEGGRIEGHHEDYDRPLEVQWVCPPCHTIVHPHSPQRIARLRWPCPDCGQEIEIRTTQIPKKNPAHCRRCAKKYCYHGHRKAGAYCRTCINARQQIVVVFRNCEDCGIELPVTKNTLAVKRKTGRLTLQRCRACQMKYARQHRWKKQVVI